MQHAFGRPERQQRERDRKQLLLGRLHRSGFGRRRPPTTTILD
jgi:hypothetical protein